MQSWESWKVNCRMLLQSNDLYIQLSRVDSNLDKTSQRFLLAGCSVGCPAGWPVGRRDVQRDVRRDVRWDVRRDFRRYVRLADAAFCGMSCGTL